jgi:hypothetical protein
MVAGAASLPGKSGRALSSGNPACGDPWKEKALAADFLYKQRNLSAAIRNSVVDFRAENRRAASGRR